MKNGDADAADHDAEGPVVSYDVAGAVATVTLNRPQYANAQNARMTYAIDEAYRRAVTDDAVAVIVLTGAGKHFSAGHDIGTPGRDVDVANPHVATHQWDHTDKPGAERHFVRESDQFLGMCRRWRELP